MSHERFYSRVNGPTLHRDNTVRWLDEVSPRHLAGGGDPRHVTEYLLASGWSNHSVPGFPHVLLESPDHRLHLTLEPQPDPHHAWWRIHPAENHTWSAQFGGHTPVEMIAGFTDALDSPAPERDVGLWDLAVHRGWTLLRNGKERAAVSPDETALLSLVPSISQTPQWRWTVQVSAPLPERERRRIWNASIDEAAPATALAGFVTALTEPGTLLRDEGQIPALVFGYLDSHRSAVTPEQHRRRHLQRLEAARRPGSPEPSPSVPPPSPPRGLPRHRKHR
ncbi:DUF317 domain-containing protein [Streptomyces sp. NPDC101230]|uniref:DUF317 domain-containing protein n=1 Tax=unclassified Streptomyces TaxID=2593676 RepID=UPI003810A924